MSPSPSFDNYWQMAILVPFISCTLFLLCSIILMQNHICKTFSLEKRKPTIPCSKSSPCWQIDHLPTPSFSKCRQICVILSPGSVPGLFPGTLSFSVYPRCSEAWKWSFSVTMDRLVLLGRLLPCSGTFNLRVAFCPNRVLLCIWVVFGMRAPPPPKPGQATCNTPRTLYIMFIMVRMK